MRMYLRLTLIAIVILGSVLVVFSQTADIERSSRAHAASQRDPNGD